MKMSAIEYSYDAGNAIGYIRINSNYDDLGLAIRVFNRALKEFTNAGAVGIVIDMRHNYGGSPLGLAGFLDDQDIELGQLEYYSDKAASSRRKDRAIRFIRTRNSTSSTRWSCWSTSSAIPPARSKPTASARCPAWW
jgi:hypothetical protein